MSGETVLAAGLGFASGIIVGSVIIPVVTASPVAPRQFNQVLDRFKIRIYEDNNPAKGFIRDMRDPPFSHGLEYEGFSTLGWETAFIRGDDQKDMTKINGRMQNTVGMYYCRHGDPPVSQWGDVPVMALDVMVIGAWSKDVLVDGVICNAYNVYTGNCGKVIWIEGKRLSNGSDDFTEVLRVFHY